MNCNHHFVNHFGSCPDLAKAYDPYRERDVELRYMADQPEFIGVTDGTDCWVAPIAGDPFRVNIVRLVADHRAGKLPQLDQHPPSRHSLSAPQPNPPPSDAPRLRRPLTVTAQPETQPRIRRALPT